MVLELCKLRLKLSNAQLLCPEGHSLKVIRINDGEVSVLYCKKCKQYYPFPEFKDELQGADE